MTQHKLRYVEYGKHLAVAEKWLDSWKDKYPTDERRKSWVQHYRVFDGDREIGLLLGGSCLEYAVEYTGTDFPHYAWFWTTPEDGEDITELPFLRGKKFYSLSATLDPGKFYDFESFPEYRGIKEWREVLPEMIAEGFLPLPPRKRPARQCPRRAP